jgi:hypothetical protein
MTLAVFKDTPWQTSHRSYEKSALAISPAPEYASSEVLVSSLYRTIGFAALKESGVPQAGKDHDKLLKRLRDKQRAPTDALVSADTWNTVIHGVLESPKRPNESTKRFIQVSPVVPGMAVLSGSARSSSTKSWPAGSLVRRMVRLGSNSNASANDLWTALFEAMSVGDDDDVFARWLQQEAGTWTQEVPTWGLVPPPEEETEILARADFRDLQFPARQFTKDLRAVIAAKDSMTRRQWTTLLEAIIRLGAVAHVAWLCDVQARIWRNVREAIREQSSGDEDEARSIFPESPQYMSYGGKALMVFKDLASGYLQARLGINAVLWTLNEIGQPFSTPLSTSEDIQDLCSHLRKNRAALARAGVARSISDVLENEARALLCKKGIGSNLMEFARHCLGQRQTSNPLLRGYDQGYVLRKKGSSPSSPWVVSLGPAAVLALTHCALAGMGGPRSIQRLVQHLAAYGVAVDRNDIAGSDLGHQLRMLGLVLDSPDAESGMLLLPPFPAGSAANHEENQE